MTFDKNDRKLRTEIGMVLYDIPVKNAYTFDDNVKIIDRLVEIFEKYKN